MSCSGETLRNRRRGDVIAMIGGEPVCLRLTLGALAELESAFAAADLAQVAARFGQGGLSARDLQAILTVAMRGGGRNITDVEAAALPVAGELPGLARAVAELLALTFGGPDDVEAVAKRQGEQQRHEAQRPFVQRLLRRARRLFHGMRRWPS